jgi:hypothetical protein
MAACAGRLRIAHDLNPIAQADAKDYVLPDLNSLRLDLITPPPARDQEELHRLFTPPASFTAPPITIVQPPPPPPLPISAPRPPPELSGPLYQPQPQIEHRHHGSLPPPVQNDWASLAMNANSGRRPRSPGGDDDMDISDDENKQPPIQHATNGLSRVLSSSSNFEAAHPPPGARVNLAGSDVSSGRAGERGHDCSLEGERNR